MGIDGIGKPRATSAGAPPEAVSTAKVSTTDATFEVGKKVAVQSVGEPSALEQLRAGKIDLDRYLDLKVQQVTAAYEDKLDPERLAFMRTTLRSQLATDPSLCELVKAASQAAAPKNDDR